jgi:hypothetical protein
MATLDDSNGCCGVDELYGLHSDPMDTMMSFCHERFDEEVRQAHVLITDNVAYRRGEKLISFIKKHKFGAVVGTKGKANPSTNGNTRVRAWLWTPNVKKLEMWWRKNREDYYERGLNAY